MLQGSSWWSTEAGWVVEIEALHLSLTLLKIRIPSINPALVCSPEM